jgi:hypothetical protein
VPINQINPFLQSSYKSKAGKIQLSTHGIKRHGSLSNEFLNCTAETIKIGRFLTVKKIFFCVSEVQFGNFSLKKPATDNQGSAPGIK